MLAWMAEMTELAATLMRGVALGLGLEPDWFEEDLTREPTVLFRIFRYPPTDEDGWGVGEHTDYGLLTILAQDGSGGLQVRGPDGWLDVPALPGVLVCNIGDMLDRMTGGRYRSTPHRVRNTQRTGTACRSRSSSIRAGMPSCARCRSPARPRPTTRGSAGTVPASTVGRDLWRLPAGQGRQGLSRSRRSRLSPWASGG